MISRTTTRYTYLTPRVPNLKGILYVPKSNTPLQEPFCTTQNDLRLQTLFLSESVNCWFLYHS